jgi:serine/threonine-protein kinase
MSAVPATFGKYYLTEKIATGGMAEIYLAKLLGPGGFEKHLIIKQIHPRFGNRREFVELFVREAKTLVSLSHGNIVPVYELGVLDDTYFIAMEYIDGPTLAELLEAAPKRRQPIAPATAAFVCAEILKGLDYAHRKGAGVIHRDLSPRNVMLSRDGEVKLVDFGIAAAVDDKAAGDEDAPPVGSFPYMSPEQARREPLSPATDLFSAGILLWEALAGRKLFARDTPEATLAAVKGADIPPPSAHNPAVPAELDEICLRALQRDPRKRFETAGDFHAKLTRYLYSLDAPVNAQALSELVARTCPPVPRARAGTDAPAAERTPTLGGTQAMPGRRSQARSKKRGQTQTFATHVQFREVLERATPLMPLRALLEGEELASGAGEPAPAEPEVAAPAEPASGRSRTGVWVVAIVVLLAAGGGAAAWVLTRGEPTGATAIDAAAAPNDGAVAAARADAAISDAGVPDAAPRRRPDAAPKKQYGRLTVPADPWGTVYLDGVQIGHAPMENKTVPAGPHTIRVVGPNDEERTFDIDVPPNGTARTPLADFTK